LISKFCEVERRMISYNQKTKSYFYKEFSLGNRVSEDMLLGHDYEGNIEDKDFFADFVNRAFLIKKNRVHQALNALDYINSNYNHTFRFVDE